MCGVNEKNNTMQNEDEFTKEWDRYRKDKERELDKEFFIKKFPHENEREQEKKKLYWSVL